MLEAIRAERRRPLRVDAELDAVMRATTQGGRHRRLAAMGTHCHTMSVKEEE